MVSVVAEKGGMDVAALAEMFSVSQATVRRDLEHLEMQRLVRRTHGGVTTHEAFTDVPLGYKSTQDLEEKRRIAREALKYIDGARVVGMTGGTTMTEFAKLLVDAAGITVVTNAINIASELVKNPGLRIFVAGGEVRSSSQECIGPNAEAALTGYNIDVVFLGFDGVSASAGCTNYDPAGANVNAALKQQGRMSVVLADATKIVRVSLAQVCPMDVVDVLITDVRAPEAELDRIRATGCRVVCV
jgi:DeoR family transcriptional regulator, aga operon transcriptional repressor